MNEFTHMYFLGIGGIGMSALARYFNAKGIIVSGYDKTATTLTNELIAEGININFEDTEEKIPEEIRNPKELKNILIVYTPAVPKDSIQLNYFKNKPYQLKKRAEVLGIITQDTYTIAIAGTHGKTTTSTLMAHLLRSAGIECHAFLGGISKNYGTNLLLGSGKKYPVPMGENMGHAEITVVEADEYDRSFLTLHPNIAVITSVDADHLDIYGEKKYVEESYALFTKQLKANGTLIVKKNVDNTLGLRQKPLSYGVNLDADFHAENIRITEGNFLYDIFAKGRELKDVTLGLPGKHNVENSVAAVAAALNLGISEDHIREGLRSFKGVKRRFDYQVKTTKLVYIDDYAHHPEELKACIQSVRQLYPGKKITGIFQPHLYSRTRDFADDFAKSLDLLDESIVMEIYPARELPIEGISAALLLGKMASKHKRICSRKEIVEGIATWNIEVLLTMGAGDIDTLVAPIRQKLLERS